MSLEPKGHVVLACLALIPKDLASLSTFLGIRGCGPVGSWDPLPSSGASGSTSGFSNSDRHRSTPKSSHAPSLLDPCGCPSVSREGR